MFNNGSLEHYIALAVAGAAGLMLIQQGQTTEGVSLISLVLGYGFGTGKTKRHDHG